MRLSNFSIVFVCIFACYVLVTDFRFSYMLSAKNNEIMYNRILDRIDEDVLFDMVETEGENQQIEISTDELYERYATLLKKNFDITDDEAKTNAAKAVSLMYFSQYDKSLSSAEIQSEIDKMTSELTRNDLSINFSYGKDDEYLQTLWGPSFISVFDPYDRYEGYDRILMSGARIIKQYSLDTVGQEN